MMQNRCRAALAILALGLLPGSAGATFVVNLPWARPIAQGASAQVFMNLTSTEAATLVAVRGPDGSTAVLRDARGRMVRSLARRPRSGVAQRPGDIRDIECAARD